MGYARLPQKGESRFENPQGGAYITPVGTGDLISTTEVSPKQLIGTIEKVKTHDGDPTAEEDTEPDPWGSVSDELGELKGRLADTYRRVANDHGPSEDEIRQAFATLAGAWDQVAESVTTALKDPDVQEKLKNAAGSFATAFSVTLSELGSELRGSNDGSDEEE